MTLTPGTILNNRYRVGRLLGQGGFGAVYRAWDINLNRACAVKENKETSPEAQRQFTREARTLANLVHPNLTRVTDHFSLPGQGQYLVMDFVEGEDLASIIERTGPVSPAQAIQWVKQVAEALAYLHSQPSPVIHRDIKPTNLRLTPDGRVMLVDFGLVKVHDTNAKTTVGARAVTPGYAPPEQYGQGTTDARTDIYALAATLYTLLTGQEPQESIQRFVNDALIPVEQVNPHVSPQLGRVIGQALRLKPSERYQSAVEFKDSLANALSIRPTPPTPAPPTVVIPKPPPQPQPTPRPSPPQPPPSGGGSRQGGMRTLPVLLFFGLCICVAGGAFSRLGAPAPTTPSAAQRAAETAALLEVQLTEEAQQTEVAQAQQTETARTTRRAHQSATAVARTATAESRHEEGTATAQAERANSTATARAAAAFATSLEPNQFLATGPVEGIINHDDDEFYEGVPAELDVKNFTAQITFLNPYPTSVGVWDYGLAFRHTGEAGNYMLYVRGNKTWVFYEWLEGEIDYIDEGSLSNLNTTEGGANQLKLIAKDDNGLFYLNGLLVAELDLSGRSSSGDIHVATGLYGESEVTGRATPYKDFTVWSIYDRVYGPRSGNLELDTSSGQVATSPASPNVANFVVDALFHNPYDPSFATWDYGFIFRKKEGAQLRITLFSNTEWALEGVFDGEFTWLASGTATPLRVGVGASNQVRLVCYENRGELYVNGEFVSELDLSPQTSAGSIMAGSGMYTDNIVDGEITSYEDFTVWEIP